MGNTPPSVWAPPFEWLKQLTTENTQTQAKEGCWCRLCEGYVLPQKRDVHLKIHVEQRRTFRAQAV